VTNRKIKVLTISDHPLSPSGVGTQSKYVIVELLKTGKYSFVSIGGAIKHEKYQPVQLEEFKDDWVIYPMDGYGSSEAIRSMLRTQKPDIVWFMTDPRFYPWLWQMENEIRALVPMVYYHVWDNYPYPTFNKIWYDSTDVVVTISKLTSDIVKTVAPEVEEHYVPHAVPSHLFKKMSQQDVEKARKENLSVEEGEFLIFWNNRNARRKQSGSLLYWFKAFTSELKKKYPDQKATLIMHTEPKDTNGQDLYAIIHDLQLDNNYRALISTQKVSPEDLVAMYNSADVTINVADAEGFGLATFESLACETPIIVTMTGGLQEQVTVLEGVSQEKMLSRNTTANSITEYEHGIGLEPASKAIIGSQEVPFIYEDRLSQEQVVEALITMYEYGSTKRDKLGAAGREHVIKNYNFEQFAQSWDKIMTDIHKNYGSWDTRKNYKSWECIAV